jgi:hypothetical protein
MKRRLISASLAALLTILIPSACSRRDDKVAVLNRLKQAAKLATVKFTFNKIVWGEKEKRIFIKLKNATFLATSKVELTAGIDLAKLKSSDIEISQKTVRVRLPRVELITYSYPFEKIAVDKAYTAHRFLNPIRLEDMEEFLRQADTAIRHSLNFLGIEERARENTRRLLAKILQKFGFEVIDIEFDMTSPLLPEPAPERGAQ